MKKKSLPFKNKILGLSYAYTNEGIELPVLDITHPLFIESADEKTFSMLSMKAAPGAEKMKNMPAVIKKIISLFADSKNSYLSGMRTLVLKLGPKLMRGQKIEPWYRLGAKQFNAIAVRIRLRNLCNFQAESLTGLLEKHPGKNVCFINIAGGAATDSINTLILILKENPALLKNRKIEINVLDLDDFGPGFAKKSIDEIRKPGGLFDGLDVDFRHLRYDWTDTGKLSALLAERKGWIQTCSSEGGLFEYAADKDIIRNLNTLYNSPFDDLTIARSLLFNLENINPVSPTGMEISGITIRILGMEGLARLLENTGWMTDKTADDGSIYSVFRLKKKRSLHDPVSKQGK